jgi:outer membrane receptor protein involved in Fe transport
MIKSATKFLLLLSVPLLTASKTYSQTSSPFFVITGKIMDEQKSPALYAIVSLCRTADSAVVKKVLTDGSGDYHLEKVNSGSYLIRVEWPGYQKLYSTPFILNNDKVLENIVLLPEETQLDNVIITNKKPFIEHRNDKVILNIANSILAAGNSALEILTKAPGVTVDQDGNISLKGKRGVNVMIDGKPTYLSSEQLTATLRATNGNSIQTIELISNPSSKYDASGTAGVINIKLKKNANYGTNGSVTAGGGYGSYYKANGGITLNHRSKNINVFGNYNYDRGKDFENLTVQRSNTSGTDVTFFDVAGHDVSKRENHSYKAGIDFDLNDKSVFGFMVSGFVNNNFTDGRSTTKIGHQLLQQDSTIAAYTPAQSQFKNQTYNLNYKTVIDTAGQEFNADLDYSTFQSINHTDYNNYFYDANGSALKAPLIFRNGTPSAIKIWAAKADYTYPFSKETKLETGVKSSYVKTDNDSKFENFISGSWQNDISRSNRFIYKEYVNAAYANLQTAFHHTKLQLGLRTELTSSEGNSITANSLVKRNYLDIFPNISVNQELTKNHDIGLSYGRRIDRPDYKSLNPFIYFADLYTFSQGNPMLNPQYTNAFTLSYGYKKTLNISLGYSHTKDVMTTTLLTDTINKTLLLFDQNLATQTLLDLNISLPVTITKWWSTTNDLSVFNRKYSTPDLMGKPFNSEKFTFFLNTTQTFSVSPSVNAELSFNYQSPQIYGTYTARPIYNTGIGISKSFLDNKANLKLAVNDVFNTQQIKIRSTVPMQDYQLYQKQESQVFRLTFTYKFGSTAIKAIRERINGSSGEQQRVKSGN